jgi:protein AATF/BFR2
MSIKQPKKRTRRSVFGLVEDLDREDEEATAGDPHSQSHKKARRRSEAAQQQIRIYGKLVECRILLQRILEHSSTESDQDTEDSVTTELETVLVKLLQARQKLRSAASNKKDTNDQPGEETMSYTQIIRNQSDLEKTLQMEYQEYRETWKAVLNRRHNDVKLRTGDLTNHKQFKVMDSSFWQQVEATAQHELMSIREKKQQQHEEQTWNNTLDDSKVYQQLLKDFVAATAHTDSGASPNGPSLLWRNNTQNSQLKKNVDRRASKGRKIRYQEISKLVQFTFPISRPIISDLDQDAWFQSLFGGAARNSQNQKQNE